jgi:hypothetical protein
MNLTISRLPLKSNCKTYIYISPPPLADDHQIRQREREGERAMPVLAGAHEGSKTHRFVSHLFPLFWLCQSKMATSARDQFFPLKTRKKIKSRQS